MPDLTIYETGSGGDAYLLGNDLATTDSLSNMVYMAMFGGNVEADTPVLRPENQQAFDWWGNTLLFREFPEAQINSRTERALNQVALNSAGRIYIQQAVEKDLEFLQALAEITVTVRLLDVDGVEIFVKVQEPESEEAKELSFLWDGTRSDLILTKFAGQPRNVLGIDHSYLDHDPIDYY